MKTRDCLKWLWNASLGVRGRVVACTLFGVLHVATSMTFVWACKTLIDAVTSGEGQDLTMRVVWMVSCLALQVVISALESLFSAKSDVLLKNRLRYNISSNLMESRWDGRETFHTGDTLNRVMEDVRVIADSITKSVPAVVVAGLQFVAAFSFLFMLQPGLAWTIPAIMLVVLVLSKTYIKRMRKLTKDIRTTESNMQSLMQESLQNRIIIHTLERTSQVTGSLSEHQSDLQEQVMDKTGYKSAFLRDMLQLSFGVSSVSVLE